MEFTPTNHPIENEFPKLIRDKIPGIIESKTGKPANTTVIPTDEEYLSYLLQKIVEEASEVKYSVEHGNMQEELADVLELVDAILAFKGWSKEIVLNIQKEKREKNGGFEKRLLLLSK
jgi:predicted house-cleaning noncanonical NTP pyrophosphatase (MazG superfamily)